MASPSMEEARRRKKPPKGHQPRRPRSKKRGLASSKGSQGESIKAVKTSVARIKTLEFTGEREKEESIRQEKDALRAVLLEREKSRKRKKGENYPQNPLSGIRKGWRNGWSAIRGVAAPD